MSGIPSQNPEDSAPSGGSDPRQVQEIALVGTLIKMEVMIYRGALSDRQPLVIINSIDLPMPPSVAFCETMWTAGYQVIFFRRPGFGNQRGLPSVMLEKKQVENLSAITSESALFNLLLRTLELKNIALIGLGTSNPICYRLAQMNPNVSFTVFANPLFHPGIWNVIRPPWLKRMIRQTLSSQSGLKIAVRGLKAVLRRDPIWFYRQFAQKSQGDLDYISANQPDFRQAGALLQRIDPDTFYYDLHTALIGDTSWNAVISKHINGVVLSGQETTQRWKREITAEAARLHLPIEFANSGDLFVPYASPAKVLEVLERGMAIRARNPA